MTDENPILNARVNPTEHLTPTGPLTVPGPIAPIDPHLLEPIKLDQDTGTLTVGGTGHNGKVSVQTGKGQPAAEMFVTEDESLIGLGTKGRPARATLYDGEWQPRIELKAADGSIWSTGPVSGSAAVLGGNGSVGGLSVVRGDGAPSFEVLHDGGEVALGAGGGGLGARLTLFGADGGPRVQLGGDGSVAAGAASFRGALSAETLHLGGNGTNGGIALVHGDGQPAFGVDASASEVAVGAGGNGRDSRFTLYRADSSAAIELNAAQGDILLYNADLAEEFDLADDAGPGTVVSFRSGAGDVLATCRSAYDTRVAGIVAGAGRNRPALVLDRRDTGRRRAPVALIGKVYVKAEAFSGQIRSGDLMTTSDVPGHVRLVTDRAAALGAVVGKAMGALHQGTGLIPMLVTLR